jgi:hypothetical protein
LRITNTTITAKNADRAEFKHLLRAQSTPRFRRGQCCIPNSQFQIPNS